MASRRPGRRRPGKGAKRGGVRLGLMSRRVIPAEWAASKPSAISIASGSSASIGRILRLFEVEEPHEHENDHEFDCCRRLLLAQLIRPANRLGTGQTTINKEYVTKTNLIRLF